MDLVSDDNNSYEAYERHLDTFLNFILEKNKPTEN